MVYNPQLAVKDDKRRYIRHNIDYMLTVEHPDGRELEGLSIDVSLGGMMVACHQAPDSSWIGETIQLRLTQENSYSESFDCIVNRLDNKLMALQLKQKSVKTFCRAVKNEIFH